MSRDLDTTRYSRGQTQDGGSARNIVLGIDIGGTFTDFVAYDKDAKTAIAWKYFSNAEDPATGIFDGLKEFQKPDRVEKIRLGTTIATNAILERKGAVVGYIATKNFTDIPHIGRGDRKGIYDAFWVKPKSLVDRKNCFGVSERISSEGDTLVDLDEKELRKIARKIRDQGNIEVIAVNFLFSYISPKHEKRTKEILAEEVPGMPISISYDVLPKWKEFERSSTTIADAYVKPIVNDRLPKIIEKIGQLMPNADVTIMKSNGGETTPEVACQQPVQLLLSGPSGGVVATQHLSKTNEIERVMTFDMGGTSCDCAICIDGDVNLTTDFEVEWGLPVQIPMVDVRTIGAGGGSIAWVDKGGMLQVGPRSAGSRPGPACYGRGGTDATVTDANVILSRINHKNFLGGKLTLDLEAARSAINRIGDKLGMGIEQTAKAIIDIANNNVASELRSMAVENGHDPRNFSLMGFGGAGPVHVADLMRLLNIRSGTVPVFPGQFSAFGFTCADARIDSQRTVQMRSGSLDFDRLNNFATSLRNTVNTEFSRQGYDQGVEMKLYVDLRYEGQNYELSVPFGFDQFDKNNIDTLRNDFDSKFDEKYGFCLPGEPIEIVNLSVTGIVAQPKPDIVAKFDETTSKPKTYREVWFEEGSVNAPIYDRTRLPVGVPIHGPAVIEEDVSTVPINAGQSVERKLSGVLVIKEIQEN